MLSSSLRIVLVEADAETRATTAVALRGRGWQVSEAQDVRGAIDAAQALQPHVILTAVHLVDAHENHFVRSFRSVVDHDILVVGMTGAARGAPGFDALMEKPIDLDQFERLVGDRAARDPSEHGKATVKMPRLG